MPLVDKRPTRYIHFIEKDVSCTYNFHSIRDQYIYISTVLSSVYNNAQNLKATSRLH